MRDQLTDWRQYAACDTLMMPGDPPGCQSPAGQPCRIGPVNADPAVERSQRLLPHIGRALLIERSDADVLDQLLVADEAERDRDLEPGSHTKGLRGPFHRYAECTNDRCPIHPD